MWLLATCLVTTCLERTSASVGGWLGLLVGLLQGVFQCAPGKDSAAELEASLFSQKTLSYLF